MACIIASFFWRVVSALPTTVTYWRWCGFNTETSYYKVIFGISEMVKLAIPPHYCQYDVVGSFFNSM